MVFRLPASSLRHLYTRFEGITWYVQTVLNRIWSSGLGLDSPRQVDNAVATYEAIEAFVQFRS